MLIGEQSGYLLTPPEFVAQPFIRRIEWSPDGNYAVLFQTALRAETPTLDDAVMRHRVLLWSRRTRRLSVLWESAQTDREVNPNREFQVAFVGKAPLCLFAVRVWDEAKQDDPWQAYAAVLGGRTIPLGAYREAWLLAPPAEDIGYILVAESENLLYKRKYAPVGANGMLANFQPVSEELDITACTPTPRAGATLTCGTRTASRCCSPRSVRRLPYQKPMALSTAWSLSTCFGTYARIRYSRLTTRGRATTA
ncbi:MAG: hypothetical protein K6U77_03610 [Armatimonadetes bacterium]|nr:hypothetical protein [Armatimonadota bacterium]